MSDDTRKSLTQHWSEKEEYAGKWVVTKMNAGVNDLPVIVADTSQEAWDEAQKAGYNVVTNEKGEQNVYITCNLGPAPPIPERQ